MTRMTGTIISAAALALTAIATPPALADDDAVIRERTVEERQGVELGAPAVRERTIVEPPAVVEKRRTETEREVVREGDHDGDVDVDVDVEKDD